MSLLNKLIEANEKRTQGEWTAEVDSKAIIFHAVGPSHEYDESDDTEEGQIEAEERAISDAHFIALAANHMDKLLAVAKAAQQFDISYRYSGKVDWIPALNRVSDALKALGIPAREDSGESNTKSNERYRTGTDTYSGNKLQKTDEKLPLEGCSDGKPE